MDKIFHLTLKTLQTLQIRILILDLGNDSLC